MNISCRGGGEPTVDFFADVGADTLVPDLVRPDTWRPDLVGVDLVEVARREVMPNGAPTPAESNARGLIREYIGNISGTQARRLRSRRSVVSSTQTSGHSKHAHNPVGRLTATHPGVVRIGRAGWFAKGLVYLIAGYLALEVASKASGWSAASSTTGTQEASPTGALRTVSTSTGGPLLLWLLAIGMLIYAAWRVVTAMLPGSTDTKASMKRVGYIVSAALYTFLAFSAIALARQGSGIKNGNQTVTDMSASIMKHSAGRLVIGVIGAIVIGVGLYRISKGLTMDVTDELSLSGMSPARVTWTRRLGAIGEVGRGVGIGLVGFFLLRSAVTYDVAQATGLDGALRRLATQSWGVVVVVIVGVGFAAYGIFCIATFTHRRLQAP